MSGNRIAWVDYARAVAIILVLLCHSVQLFYRDVLYGTVQVASGVWLFEHTLFILGRLGVPLFLMLTGMLLLERDLKPAVFYRKSLLPLLLSTEIWIILNEIFAVYIMHIDFSLKALLSKMLFLDEQRFAQMWYMPMILGMYLVMPFLSALTRLVANLKMYLPVLAAGIVSFILLPTANVFWSMFRPDSGSLIWKVDSSFWGGLYGLYIILGWMIGKRRILFRIRSSFLILVFTLGFGMTTAGQYFLYCNEYYENIKLTWYSSAGIFVMGICFFEIMRRLFDGRKLPALIRLISQCSFGIFLIHRQILEVLRRRCVDMVSLPVWQSVLLLFLGTFGISFVIVVLFVPLPRWISGPLFYMWKKKK